MRGKLFETPPGILLPMRTIALLAAALLPACSDHSSSHEDDQIVIVDRIGQDGPPPPVNAFDPSAGYGGGSMPEQPEESPGVAPDAWSDRLSDPDPREGASAGPVPEPPTVLLVGSGLVVFVLLSRRKRNHG